MKKIQLTLQQMRAIIEKAENMQAKDDSFSNTVIITVLEGCKRYTGGDEVVVHLVNGFQDHTSFHIY
jgi:hypothetical protein